MNVVPDPRAVERWLWSRYLLSWGAILLPVTLAGLLTGIYYFPFGVGNIGYYSLLGMLTLMLAGVAMKVLDTIIDRWDTLKFWRAYMEMDIGLQPRAAKIRADSVLHDYRSAHQPPREVDA